MSASVPAHGTPKGGGVSVLLIHPQALFHDALGLLLQSIAPVLRLIAATNLDAGLVLLRSTPRPAAVIACNHLLGATGHHLVRRILEVDSGIPVVLLTPHDTARPDLPPPSNANVAAVLLGNDGVRALADALMRCMPTLPRPAAVALPGTTALPPLVLPPRQLDVLRCMVRGQTNKAIARELGIADSTVKSHLAAVFSHLGVRNRTEAMFALGQRGMQWRDIAAGAKRSA